MPSNRRASAWRWRSVIDPTVLFSDMGIDARSLRHRVLPQRRWLVRRSETVIEAASHGHSRMTCAAEISPSATWRLSSARARRTSFARANARRCCGAGAIVAAAFICPPYRPTLSVRAGNLYVLVRDGVDARAQGG